MAKSIMIQGTMSSVGKSIITTGLCRIFKQDGYRVCPFKAQNLTLNSYTTDEGLEMGNAQVIQAHAAGVKPSALMNPVLIKPTKTQGLNILVKGKSIGYMTSKEYSENKKKIRLSVVKAYEDLSKEYDIVVLEGAGSPAEININTDDIVNMGMAKIANSPVLLVGDIERGGVFASIYGTLMLLKEDERSMVKGVLINKFRGNINLLDTGITMLEDITSTSVIGTIPYTDIDIEDEDSLSESFKDKTSNIYKESYSREELRIYKEKQYDSLADMLRENIDMKEIYKILEMGL